MTDRDTSSTHWDGEVDLKRYLLVLIAWWREIVLGAFLIAVMGGATTWVLTVALPKYESSADVAIIWTGKTLSADADVERGDLVAKDTQPYQDHPALRIALTGLVHNGNVADSVVERLGGSLEDDRFAASKLLESISAGLVLTDFPSLVNQSDLIRITAKADSPEMAETLANTWAEEYIMEVNKLYEWIPRDTNILAQRELEKTITDYENIQIELDNFLSDSKSFLLRRQIKINNKTISNLEKFRDQTFIALFDHKIDAQSNLLRRKYDARFKLKDVLDSALSLRAQIEKGGSVASNGLAIQLLKVQAYVMVEHLPQSLEISFNTTPAASISPMEQTTDIDSLILALRERIEALDLAIAEQDKYMFVHLTNSTEIVDEGGTRATWLWNAGGPDILSFLMNDSVALKEMENDRANSSRDQSSLVNLIVEKEKENQALSKMIDSEIFKKERLINTRDLLRSKIEALQIETLDIHMKSSIAPSVLRLASPAIMSQKSSWPSPIFIATVSWFAGLILLVFMASLLHILGIRPLLRTAVRSTSR